MTLGVPKDDDHLYRLPLGSDAEDRMHFSDPYASVIGFGAPRTGKTRNVAVPALAAYPGTVVAVSVRADVFDQTREARHRRGPVGLFDPSGVVGDAPELVGWNILKRCSDFQFAIELAQTLAEESVPATASRATDWRFWSALARKLVAPCLFAAASSGGTLADVVRWVQTREEYEVRSLIQSTGEDRALQMIDGVWQSEDRTRSSVYSTADAMIGPFESPALAAALADGIDVEDFVNVPGSTLYVVVPATRQAVYAPVVTAMISTALNAAVTKAERTNEPARVMVVLDEAGNIGRIDQLASRASTSQGFGITMVSLFHDHAQLRRTYGEEEAQTVLGAHHVLMALRGVDPATAALIDGRIGDEPVPSLPRGTGIDRLRRIPGGYAIVTEGGDDPELLRLPSLDDPLLRVELRL